MVSSASSASSWSDSGDKKAKNNSDEKEYDSDGNELYVVEEIRDKRKQFDKKQGRNIWLYQLKWKGYGLNDMTWEPQHNLDCPDLLAEFELKWEKKQSRDSEKNKRQTDRHSLSKTHSSQKKRRHRSNSDSDPGSNRPSTSGLSKSSKKSKLDSLKKRKLSTESESDSNEDQMRNKVKPGPKRVKEALLAKKTEKSSAKKDSDSDDEDMKSKHKPKKHDSDSDSEKMNKSKGDDDLEKRILSKPGPKRAKEARLAKLKANESTKSKNDSDIETDDKKDKQSNRNTTQTEPDSKANDSDDDRAKRLMSKPGPKRAKEARLARLNTSKGSPDRDREQKEDSKATEFEANTRTPDKGSKIDSTELDLEKEKQVILSKPGPKRAKEARLAKLSSTPKLTTTIELTNEDDSSRNRSNSDVSVKQIDRKERDSDSISDKKDKNSVENKNEVNKSEKERILSRPGPKAAKEARLARLNQLEKSENKNDSENDSFRNCSQNDNSLNTDNEKRSFPEEIEEKDSNSEQSKESNEEIRKKVMSRPGPKRAKEARLKKMDESLKSVSEENVAKNSNLDKRTNSTDSLDAIISTPAHEQEKQIVAEISRNDSLGNGLNSDQTNADKTVSEQKGLTSKQIDCLSKIGNHIDIETTKYINDISHALSVQTEDLNMERPGYIRKAVEIARYSKSDAKNIDKIVSAFYCEKKLCFLIKCMGNNKCQVITSDELNKFCPQMVIDYYQSRLRFN